MISIGEAQIINDSLDKIFKFKVGDFVQVGALGEYIEKPIWQGYSHKSNKEMGEDRSWINLNFGDPKVIYQVVERLLQQCHGGVQKHYYLRMMMNNGAIERQLLQMTENELVLSAPFRRSKELTKEEVIKYANDVLKD
jgi:hypothetical protein